MTDDEILVIANEVLVPAGIHGAQVRRPALEAEGAAYRAITVLMPIEPPKGKSAAFHFGWSVYPESPPMTRERITAAAHGLVDFIVRETATWPTPWVPANQARRAAIAAYPAEDANVQWNEPKAEG